MARKIEVVDYNPEWSKQFKDEAKKIKAILGKNCVAVYHIGSTSVKGMKSKPVIDIMPVVKDIASVDELNSEFEKIGYECMGEHGIVGRRFYRKGGNNRTHHIHIFEKNNETDIRRHLAVKEYLSNHLDVAKEYEQLKISLAEKYPYDNEGYCDGKDEFIKKMEQDALKWKKRQERIATGMSVGMMFGMSIGMSFGSIYSNQGIGMCLGMGIGMCLGIAFGAAKRD